MPRPYGGGATADMQGYLPGLRSETGAPAARGARSGNDFVLNLSEIIRLVRQGLWLILGTTLAGGVLAAWFVFQIPPTFTATSQIVLGSQSRADDALGNLFKELDLDNQQIAGQMAVMRSGPILTRVSETLELHRLPEFNAELLPPPPPPGPIAQLLIQAEDLAKSMLGAESPEEVRNLEPSFESVQAGETFGGAGTEPVAGDETGAAAGTETEPGEPETGNDPVASEAPPSVAAPVNPLVAASLAEKQRLRDQEDYVSQLSSGLRVRQEGNAALVNISYTSENPIIAAAVVNTLADQYISFQLEEKFVATRRMTDGLNERLAALKLRLVASERAVLEFEDEMLGSESGGSKRLEQQMRELSSRLVTVSAQRAELEAELREIGNLIESEGTLAVVGVVESDVIRQLRKERSDLYLRAAQLQSRLSSDDTRLADVNASIAQTEAALSAEVLRLHEEMASQTAVAAAREESLKDQLQGLERRYLTLSQELIQLTQLEREAEASRLVYETFLKTFTQTSEVVDLQEADARVVAYAKPPSAPSAPNKKVSVALGLVAGLFAGLGFVFLRATLNKSIDTLDKLRRHLGWVPVAALMPMVRRGFFRGDPLADLSGGPNNPVTEAARKLRNVLMMRRRGPGWKVAVLSGEPDEGKTTTSLLLANAVAQTGHRCVVVETDLRGSSIARLLGQEASPDLVDVLSGDADLDDALRLDERTGAWILAAQPGVTDPAALLWSERMSALVQELEEKFDMIIFDTPPLLSVSDALPVFRHTDDAILAVRWRKASSEKLQESLDLLQQVGMPLTCVVMTMTRGKILGAYKASSYGEQPATA